MAAAFNMMPGYINVKAYGAVGNGSTDDTAAIQAAIDAAEDAGGGVVYFPPGIYFVDGAFGGSNSENAQIRFPTLVMASDPAITIRLVGSTTPGVLMGFGDTPVLTGGSIIKTTKTGGGNLFGVGQGGGLNHFSGIYITAEELTFVTYANPDICVFDMRDAACFGIRNVSIYTNKPSHNTITEPTHSAAYGVRFPATDNSACVWADNLVVYGFYVGIEIAECFHGTGQVFIYACKYGVVCTPMNHGAFFASLQTARCPTTISGPASGTARVTIPQWRNEWQDSSVGGAWMNETYTVDDSGNRLHGSATLCSVEQGVGADTHLVKNSATNFDVTAI